MSETPTATAAPEKPVPDIKMELSRIRSAHADAVMDVEEQPARGMFWIGIKPRSIVAAARLLRDDKALDFKLLTDLTCIDRPWEPKRFCVTYNFYSLSRNRRVFLRVRVAE